ncbi:unnamed protein product [Laminaria digitata]
MEPPVVTPDEEPQRVQTAEGASEAVLLYYKYVNLGEERRAAVQDWYLHSCSAEGLRGRVRVALDGVNCTLGGSHAALRRHIDGVMAHADIEGENIDFKLSASQGPRSTQAAEESGFTTLSVKAVKEVVSMGPRGAGLSHQQGGRHVTPQEFHVLLRQEMARKQRLHEDMGSAGDEDSAGAGARVSSPELRGQGETEEVSVECKEKAGKGGGEEGRACESVAPALCEDKEAVLLDVRNVYETSIGHFRADGVERLDPKTRQFSQLPKWVDENVDRLRGKRVLMYCTGGVRCEMASALLRQHCDADATGTEVLQLSGGIERYLEAYPAREVDASAENEGGRRSEGGATEGAGERAGASAGAGGGLGTVKGQEEEGFFRGKNFVFDERVSVPEAPAGGAAVGHCILCEQPWDDYGSRSRCTRCRMLVLVCDACVEIRGPEKASTTSVVFQGLPTDTGTHTARSDAAVRVPAQPPAEGAPDIGETAAAAAAVGATMTTARRGRGAEETGGARGRRDNPAAAQTVCGVPSEAKEAAPHLTCSSCSHRALGCV